MHRKKRPFKLLILTLLSAGALYYIAVNFPPNYQLLITNYKIPIVYVFFLLFFLFSSTFFAFFLNYIRRGFFLGAAVTTYLLLRYLNLTHPLFALGLLAIFLALELVFTKKHQ